MRLIDADKIDDYIIDIEYLGVSTNIEDIPTVEAYTKEEVLKMLIDIRNSIGSLRTSPDVLTDENAQGIFEDCLVPIEDTIDKVKKGKEEGK